MGDYIKSEIKPDMIAWTGDIAPHDMWNYDLDYVMGYTQAFNDYLKTNLSEFSIYPLEGNHDFGVANSQTFDV